jgi:hypothetical protein
MMLPAHAADANASRHRCCMLCRRAAHCHATHCRWCGIVQWSLYNIAVILIFTINAIQYRDVGRLATQRGYCF